MSQFKLSVRELLEISQAVAPCCSSLPESDAKAGVQAVKTNDRVLLLGFRVRDACAGTRFSGGDFEGIFRDTVAWVRYVSIAAVDD